MITTTQFSPRHVLVAFAGSDAADTAVDLGLELAAATGAEVCFLHVEEPTAWRVGRLGASPAIVRALPTSDDSTLAAAARAAAVRDVQATLERLSGDETDTILARAEQLDADVIVVAESPRGRFTRHTIADEVASRSARSVLVARPPLAKAA
jgi:nucleotide-binding universal stress UspA family protein